MGKLRQKAKRKKAKAVRDNRAASRRAIPEVKKVVLPSTGVVQVVVPKGVVPVVAVDPKKNIVEIVPVPVKKTETWWHYWFGPVER